MKKLPTEPRKILIIQTAFIGDVVLTTPLIREVKHLFPTALVDVLVIPQTKQILENNPYVHTLFTFDKRGNKTKAFRETAQLLRQKGYDLCVTPHRSLTSAMLAAIAKIPVRIGFAGNIQSLTYSIRIPFDQQENQINRCLDLLRALNSKDYNIQTELYFSQHDVDTAQKLCSSIKSKTRIAVAPGSVWPTKRWPEERFIALIQQLGQHDAGFVLVGSKDERALCDRIAQQATTKELLNLAKNGQKFEPT